MYCKNCGQVLGEGEEVCRNCGTPVSRLTRAKKPGDASPVSPGSSGDSIAGRVPSTPPPYITPMRQKSRLPWILGGLGLLALIAVILVLVLVVFKGAESPEDVVQKLYTAMEKRSTDMFLKVLEPRVAEELVSSLGGELETVLDEELWSYLPRALTFSDLQFATEISGHIARVTQTGGVFSFIDEYGERESMEWDESDEGYFELVKINGEWYITTESIYENIGIDLEYMIEYSDDYDYDYDYYY